MKFDPEEPRTYNPSADLIPEWLSITKSHYERMRRNPHSNKNNGAKIISSGAAQKIAEKNSKPITLINESIGGTVKYKSQREAAGAVGYKNPNGCPIAAAIKRKSEKLPDGSIRVTMMGTKYRVILEEKKNDERTD